MERKLPYRVNKSAKSPALCCLIERMTTKWPPKELAKYYKGYNNSGSGIRHVYRTGHSTVTALTQMTALKPRCKLQRYYEILAQLLMHWAIN